MWCKWLPSFGIVGKDGKEKQPHIWDILRHWHSWEYFNSPYSSLCLGRSWAQGPPDPSCLRNLVLAFPNSQPVPGSPLQAHFCLDGGSERGLVCGGLQGFPPAAVTHIPAVVRLPKPERRGGAARVPKGAVIAISWCVSVLPFSSTLSPVPEIWLVIDQDGLKKWCQPELWIDLLLSVCHTFIAVLAQCVWA